MAVPFYVPETMSFDLLTVYTGSASNDTTAYAYIYGVDKTDAYGLGTKVAALGGMSLTSTYADVNLTISQTLSAGWYFLVLSRTGISNSGPFYLRMSDASGGREAGGALAGGQNRHVVEVQCPADLASLPSSLSSYTKGWTSYTPAFS